jgi:ribonuclease R
MLPNIYADDLLSLIENKNRFAVSLILNINRNNLIINSFEIKETIVKNIKNYNYDEFDIILKKNKELKKFVNDSKLYFKSLNNNIDNFDSHKLVEYWMIFTNKFIANYLINECKNKIIDKDYSGNIILRILTRKNIENNNSNIFIESSLIEYINNKNENSALYELFDEEMEKNQFHYKLGNEYYTHFTSPIRRVVDIIIHGILLKNNKLMDKKLLENYLIKINKFNKNNRRFDRNIKRLEFLYNQKEKKENIITFGYIINIQERYIKIYLPEYGLEEKIIIIPFIFKNIVESVVEKNDFDEIKSIKYILDEKEYYYKLYQKLNIKLWIFLFAENIFDKLKIEII